MSSRPVRRRFALRSLAAALAVGYTLLAAVGDGLHGLVCLDECCSGAACCGGEDAETCLFCHHGEGRHGAEQSGAAPSHRHEGPQSPAPHDNDCDVCRLLAQLKTATATVDVPAQVIWAAAPAPPESDPKAPSLSLAATSARGPPIA